MSRILLLALAARVGYLFCLYVLGRGGVMRFHVESACAMLVIFGVATALVGMRAGDGQSRNDRLPVWAWFVFCGIALVVYFPAISLGFLSDDYVLFSVAEHWQLGAFNAIAFRPLPLLLWSVVAHVGQGAAVLHVVNVLIHGTNAYFTTKLVAPFVSDARAQFLAGLVFLCSPLSPEAVAWCSGIFDSSACLFVLAVVLVGRRYDDVTRPVDRMYFFALTAIAILCKEVAAVIPVLVVIDGWVRRRLTRSLACDVGVATIVLGMYGVFRAANNGTSRTLTKFMLQRTVFSIFGSFAVPWHVDIATWVPWVVILYGMLILAAVTWFFLNQVDVDDIRLVGAGGVWMLASVVPTLTFFVVAEDLQGARYLYLASVGWTLLLLGLLCRTRNASRRVPLIALTAIIVLSVYGLQTHLTMWTAAAKEIERIEAAAKYNPQMLACSTIKLDGLPDSRAGVYIFRNGVAEAFARDVGMRVNADATVTVDCTFRWAGERFEPSR